MKSETNDALAGNIKENIFDGKLPAAYCDLHFDEAVKSWDEAVPLGNGLTGCLIWGNGNPLRLSLDRGIYGTQDQHLRHWNGILHIKS